MNDTIPQISTLWIMLRKRSIIESLNDMLKNVAQLVHSRHRSVHNFLMNLLGVMGAYCFFAVKPQVNFDFDVPASDGQLVLWDLFLDRTILDYK